MKLSSVTVSPFAMNAYLVVDESSGRSMLVDPGDELDSLISLVEASSSKLELLVATHCHLDHIGAAAVAKKHFGVEFWCHRGDDPLRETLGTQAAMFGLPAPDSPSVDRYLEDGETIELGETVISVLHTPGHSPGSISLYHQGDGGGEILSGDVLFAGSIGRTDLPGGSFDQLMATIRERFLSLPDETEVYPGHGPKTSIGAERRTNPFLQT